MFSGLIPGLNSVEYPEEEFIPGIPVALQTLLNQTHHPLSFSGGASDFVCPAAGLILVLMIGSLLCSLCSKESKKVEIESHTAAPGVAATAGDWTGSDAERMVLSSFNEVYFHDDKAEIVSGSDANYAEQLQVQEALLASLLTSPVANSASSSTPQARLTLSSLLNSPGKEVAEASQSFCEICLENKETWKMFENSACSHSFCYSCTRKHIIAKIQENIKIVTCPGLNCKTALDFNACRLMIPKDILLQWDELLCKSMILESQKLYCPFSDCSTLLVNDNEGTVQKIDCPACQRSFCATCLVPWHSEFTCKEFEKLNAKKKGKDDMVEVLAKKKKWRRCPSCKFFIEKNEGCLHMTCRCKYEFCYKCGSKWKSSHGGCRPRS